LIAIRHLFQLLYLLGDEPVLLYDFLLDLLKEHVDSLLFGGLEVLETL
jgi:hypothetical protein